MKGWDEDSDWILIEDQVPMKKSRKFATNEKPSHLAIFIHPPYEAKQDIAMAAVDSDLDFEATNACFYCGDVAHDLPCNRCGQELCEKCTADVGCYCMRAEH